MKAHIKIPRGWRRLRKTEKVKIFDMRLSMITGNPSWINVSGACQHMLSGETSFFIIRKARKGGKGKP